MPQTLPAFVKTWDFTKLNVSIPYTSVNDTMATLLFSIKDYLVTTMGATVVMSSTGTAAGASDLITSKTSCATRGATILTAQSYYVINWAGVQMLISYTSTSDDALRYAYSQDNKYRINTAATSFTFTVASTTLDTFTATAHGQSTGNGLFQATTSSSLPSGLVANTNYWFIRVDADTFKLATSYDNAIAGIAVDVVSAGVGTQTLANPGPLAPPGVAANTESLVFSSASTAIGTSTSANRIFSIQATTDRSIFRLWVFHSNTLQSSFGLEKIVEAPGIPTGTVFGWCSAIGTFGLGLNNGGHHAGVATGSAGSAGYFTSFLSGAPRNVYGGSVTFGGLATPGNTGALNGGFALYPLLVGCETSPTFGWVGTRIDGYYCWANQTNILTGQTADDPVTGTRVMAVGTMMTPWSPTQGLIRT